MNRDLKWLMRTYVRMFVNDSAEDSIDYPEANKAVCKTLFLLAKVLYQGKMISFDTKRYLLFSEISLAAFIRKTSSRHDERARYLSCWRDLQKAKELYERVLSADIVEIIQIENELKHEFEKVGTNRMLPLESLILYPFHQVTPSNTVEISIDELFDFFELLLMIRVDYITGLMEKLLSGGGSYIKYLANTPDRILSEKDLTRKIQLLKVLGVKKQDH